MEGAEPGNLEGVIRRLDYVRDLGFNCIELMPTGEFAMSHSLGYNPAHIFAVEEAYGGPHGLKTLVKEAHARGIAVILDVVYNHFGPSDLDLWQFDGWTENGKGGIYFYEDWRSSTPWGDTRPDYRRGEVRQFIRDNALFWLEEFRFDGLRWDATGQIRNARGGNHPGDDLPEGWELIRWVNAEVNARQPWKLLIAEDLQTNAAVTRNPDQGGAGFDSQWDAQFVHPVREALITPHDGARHMHAVAHAIRFAYDGDPLKRVIYTESHDEVMNGRARVPHDVNPRNAASWESQKRSTLGGALVFTAPGIPMIFQGQEFLEDGWFVDADPLDWTKLERFGGIHRLYHDLVHLRRNCVGHHARAARPARARAPRERRGQGRRIPSLGRGRPRRRRDRGGQLRQPRVRSLPGWLSARRRVEGALQQRLERLLGGFRQPPVLARAGRGRSARRHAVQRRHRHRPVHRHHPLAGLEESLTQSDQSQQSCFAVSPQAEARGNGTRKPCSLCQLCVRPICFC